MFNLRPAEIASNIFTTLAVLGAVLRLLALVKMRRHFRAKLSDGMETPPLTLWRAHKPGAPGAEGKLRALIESARADDQILIGCDETDAALCLRLREQHPGHDITVVVCEPERVPNPKISKFIQMTPHARHPHWLLTDSEAVLTRELLGSLRIEWAASGADVLTAGYRFEGARAFCAQLDTLPALTTLWPGLMLAGRPRFTLGACVAVRARDVVEAGGWAAFGHDLAEDYRLGRALDRGGLAIRISHQVLPLEADPVTLGGLLRHQHRMAVTYRAASPAGASGLPLLHCWPLAVAALLSGAWRDAVTAAACAVVFIACVVTTRATAGLTGAASPRVTAVLLSPLLETAAWLLAWFTSRVFWAGRWRRVDWRGRFISGAAAPSAGPARISPGRAP